jgi:hypothetical protein
MKKAKTTSERFDVMRLQGVTAAGFARMDTVKLACPLNLFPEFLRSDGNLATPFRTKCLLHFFKVDHFPDPWLRFDQLLNFDDLFARWGSPEGEPFRNKLRTDIENFSQVFLFNPSFDCPLLQLQHSSACRVLCITSPLAFRLVTDHPSDIPRTFFRFRL